MKKGAKVAIGIFILILSLPLILPRLFGQKKPAPMDETRQIIQALANMKIGVTSIRRSADGTLLLTGLPKPGRAGALPAGRRPAAMKIGARMSGGKLVLNPRDVRAAGLKIRPLPTFKPAPKTRAKIAVRAPRIPNQMRPDLRVSEVIFSPTRPKRGETVMMEVYIANQGVLPASFPSDAVPLRVVLPDGSIIEDFPQGMGTVASGQEGVLMFNLPPFAAQGDFTIGCRVDPGQRLSESDENNNDFSAPLAVRGSLTPEVNLRVMSARLRPSRITESTRFREIVAEVRNEGPEATARYDHLFLVGLAHQGRSDDRDIGYFDLEAGESFDFAQCYNALTWARPGELQTDLTADPRNQVVETNENDNRIPFAVRVYADSDIADKTNLTIDGIRLIPENPSQYDEIGIEVRIRNSGRFPAVFEDSAIPWQAIVQEGPTAAQYFDFTWTPITLAPGETISRTGSGNYSFLEPGLYRMEFTINPDRWVTETDYSDNIRTLDFTVRSRR